MKTHDISSLETKIGYHFRDPKLLERALTHSSYAREHYSADGADNPRDNEQLEFLGDAVLGFVTSEALLERYPNFHEGRLSKLRAHLVSEKHLIETASKLKIGYYLRLGKGEAKSGGELKTSLQVDALEALLAAMYLDSGIERPREFILHEIVEPELKRLKGMAGDGFPITDYKSALQETAHSMARPQPSYVLVKEEGPEHRKTFTVEVRLHEHGAHGPAEHVARGKGPTKKKAEQEAAKKAIQYLWKLSGGTKTRPKQMASSPE